MDAMLKCKAVVDLSASSFPCIHVADKHDTKNSSATKATFLDKELAQLDCSSASSKANVF